MPPTNHPPEDLDEDGPELPLPPALSPQPISQELATLLLDEVAERFPNPHDALEELLACGSTLFDDVIELVEEKLGEPQFAIIVPVLIELAFAFAPPGTLQPELNLDTMEDALEELLDDGEIDPASLIHGSKQPHLLRAAIDILTEINSQIPRTATRLNSAELCFATVLLRVVSDEFDTALRLDPST